MLARAFTCGVQAGLPCAATRRPCGCYVSVYFDKAAARRSCFFLGLLVSKLAIVRRRGVSQGEIRNRPANDNWVNMVCLLNMPRRVEMDRT